MTTDPSKMTAEEKRALLANLLKRKAEEDAREFPLAHGQRALWFEYALDPESSAYNIAFAARVRSAVDVAAFERAWQVVIERHAALRATFPAAAGEPRQVIVPSLALPFAHVEAAGDTEAELLARVVEYHRKPFVLDSGPVFRIGLFSLREDDHVVLFSVHHIAADGWSLRLIFDDFANAYAAEATASSASLPAPAASYRDFVNWQTEQLAGEGARLRSFWTSALAGELPVFNLSRRTRPAGQRIDGRIHGFALPEPVHRGITDLAKATGVTPFVVLLSAFAALLSRSTGASDIIIGTPALGRSRADFQGVVGYFVNPLALRSNLADDPSFTALLERTRDVVQQALAHQDYPFPLLVEALRPKRDLSHTPIFQVMFNLVRLPAATTPASAGGLALAPFLIPQEEGQFALALDLADFGDRITAGLRFDRNQFDGDEATRFADRYIALLSAAIAAPGTLVSRLSLVPQAERSLVVNDWNRTDRPLPSATTAATLFEASVDRTPDAVAAIDGSRRLSYAELDAAANQLAHHLRRAGIDRGALVGISLDRRIDMVVAVLAVMKAGAGYVPLDPSYPAARLKFMASDSGIQMVVTEREYREVWQETADVPQVLLDDDTAAIATCPVSRPTTVSIDSDLAYVIYTSGSTGQPKGVEIEHRALVNFLVSMQERPGFTADDRLLAVTTLSFDIAGLELLGPLVAGARIVIATRDDALDGQRLAELIASEDITILQATPATWRLLLAADWPGTPRLKMLCGGEALPQVMANDLVGRGGELWNMYGPTETTIWSTVDKIEAGQPITIGRPIANTRCYVLDAHLQPVGIGMVGELYIGGEGLARGYHHRPELTAERFVADPFRADTRGRMYRTGDLARFRDDGRLECLGRVGLDTQVKVRGYRIELGEIESVLEGHPAVSQAAAVVHGGGGDARLVAYVVVKPGMQSTHSEWRQFLRQHLPAYMVPTLFVEVAAMPLTPAGKVDRKALPDPLRSAERVGGQPPATPVEKKVAAIWSEVLNGAAVHRDDNFFDIGGHSLASMQVIARLESEFGVRILPASLTLETLEQVAARCQAAAVVAHEGDAVNAAVAAAAPKEGTAAAAADQPPASGFRSRLVSAFKNVVSRE